MQLKISNSGSKMLREAKIYFRVVFLSLGCRCLHCDEELKNGFHGSCEICNNPNLKNIYIFPSLLEF